MAEQNLDIDYVKTNLDKTGLLELVGESALKASITTAVIIGAVLSVVNVENLAENIRFYVYTAITTGAFLSVLFAVQYYYGKLFYWFDLIYTTSIDPRDNWIQLLIRTAISVILALLITAGVYLFQYYAEIISVIGYCSLGSTVFIYYVFRNKLIDLKTYLLYAGYGVATGTAAYLLGAVIVIAYGLIGFWMTNGLLVLETTFTGIYTYLGLLEWVNQSKEERKLKLSWEERKKNDEEAKEILSRLT